MADTVVQGRASDETFNKFRKVRRDAEFLFGREIDAKLAEVSSAFLDLNTYKEDRDFAEGKDAVRRIERYLGEMYELFEPYMPTDMVKPKVVARIRDFGKRIRLLALKTK